MNAGHDLIDTSEMYLRTVLELEEEGVVPLRARIAERLQQSVPTVSQTVGRLQRDGLMTVSDDRRIALTPEGRAAAVRVMRKHRLAECLLVDVIGLDWELVHEEACRWEHVISETVERRLLEVLGHPTESPYGNPIPGLTDLGEPTPERGQPGSDGQPLDSVVALDAIPVQVTEVVVRRIGEPLQSDRDLLSRLRRAGMRPNVPIAVAAAPGGVRLGLGETATVVAQDTASHLFVTAVD